MQIENIAAKVIKEREEWLERVLFGLLAGGFKKDEIEVQQHPDLVTVVTVRGNPKYRYQILFEGGRYAD